ncbi:nuclear-pore anchor-like [Zingiber officinale]|uniref:nuclear-pore anchor-like n=1 Tax=Zingiber officinale TaxID=94328 RepID=UPI001C4D05E7|nr:nuclear-pore anchor-like [Zingiber officinale]
MPLFLSEEEFRLISDDATAVAQSADAAIRDLHRQLDTLKAESDASSIAAEQNCALFEQRYETLSSDLAQVRAENAQLSASLEKRFSEIADAQAEKHQLHLKAIAKDGETERLSLEVGEVNKSKRHLLELLEQKDAEVREKNTTLQSYLDKIINLTESAAEKEARLLDLEAECARTRFTCNCVNQEKELLEKHNTWLNEEFSMKVNCLIEERKAHMEVVADLSAKLSESERQINDYSSSLKHSTERVDELEVKNASLEKELCSSKDSAATNEVQLTSELSTVRKLAELYKERSEEWSKKSGELEGVIKALETHLCQVENEYKDKLEKESSQRKNLEKDAADMKGKIEKYEAELENARKSSEISLVPVANFHLDSSLNDLTVAETTNIENNQILVPKIPLGVSGTALAASLLRDGWSLAKMYEKYQEAADALRHEKWGRKNAEAVLARVLHEIEEKAELILDERDEHARMIEAYNLMNKKLLQSLEKHENFENTILHLKAESRKWECEYTIAQKEITDLEKQVTLLLKECQEIQVRCGVTQLCNNNPLASAVNIDEGRSTSEHLISFKDINELVEQNVQLRGHVARLSTEMENKETELMDAFQIQLQKITAEAASKVEAMLKRSEEQGQMIESLHSSVAMYRRLYEEEQKISASTHPNTGDLAEDRKNELMLMFEGSQDVSKKAYDRLAERSKGHEEDLAKFRGEATLLRSERDKKVLEANFAKDQVDGLKKEIEHQRKEANAVSARNVELTQLVVDFQKRLRESSNSVQEAEEIIRKLSMEVSILKHEKEILTNSERRATDEIHNLSERLHRLQSTLDTIQSADEVRESSRTVEIKKLEEYAKRVEREWAEANRELQEERNRVRVLTNDKDNALETSIKQLQEMKKELADAWATVTSAESRAAIAEARCSEIETRVMSGEQKDGKGDARYDHPMFSTNEDSGELWRVREELERLREESQANKDYMVQYKEIAHTNEMALKQIESAHEAYKLEAEKVKRALADDVSALRNKVSEMEKKYILKCEEVASLIEAKDREISALFAETSSLRVEISQKLAQIESLETQVSSLKEDLDGEHKQWQISQRNYERQVMLQSETIQELTKTSHELSSLQCEVVKLREVSDMLKNEKEILKSSWENEKTTLHAMKDESDKKYNEVNEQNKILHSQLESLYARFGEKGHNSAGIVPQTVDSKAESDLHSVISYLRRSKEIAETEIILLKQEKLRHQTQLETALKASETAKELLQSKRENDRALLLKDEELKALLIQVREINLLRESNVQLREENKHNFEEFQRYLNEAQKARVDAEKFENLLREKQLQYDASQKEVDVLRTQIDHLNIRISELAECYKNIDLVEYEKMKDEREKLKVFLRKSETEIELTKKLLSEKQETIANLDQSLAKCQLDLAEQEKRVNNAVQAQGTIKLENEKQKKIMSVLKKRNDNLMKEKEELNQEKMVLLKEIDDFKSGQKTSVETSIKQATKEKDTRIQILERTLERERDENKKQKQKRESTEKTIFELIQKISKEKKALSEEFLRHKLAAEALKSSGGTTSQLPSETTLSEQFDRYIQATVQLETAPGSIADVGPATATDTVSVDASIATAGRRVATQPTRPLIPQVKPAVEKEKDSAVVQPTSSARRIVGRRIVRPRLARPPEEPQADGGTSGVEGSSLTEDEKTSTSHEHESSGDNLFGHPASSGCKNIASTSNENEDVAPRDLGADAGALLKEMDSDEMYGPTSSAQVAPTDCKHPALKTLQKDLVDATRDELGADVVPPLKKSKYTDGLQDLTQDISNEQAVLPSAVDVETTEASFPSVLHPTSEEIEVDQVMEEILDSIAEESFASDQQNPSLDESAVTEDFPDKPKETCELLDESLRSKAANEITEIPAAEDDREEGELPDEMVHG